MFSIEDMQEPTQEDRVKVVTSDVSSAIVALRLLVEGHDGLDDAHAVFNPADLEVLQEAQEILRKVKECVPRPTGHRFGHEL